jgi:hypothetical protein
MKKILFIAALFCSLLSYGQGQPPGYTYIAQRYDWLAGKFRALHIPAVTDTAFTTGQYTGAGAVLIDTTGAGQGFYYRMNNRWNKVGDALVNLPLYKIGDTININQADANNDGYLTAPDWARFDSAAGMFKDTLTGLPAIVPKDSKLLYVRHLLLGPTSAISFYNTAWDSSPYPLLIGSPESQNAFFGDRGGATRTLAGTLTGQYNTGFGSQTFNALTTGDSNTVVGKGAGSFLTTADNSIYIGHNMSGTGYGTVSGRLGIGGNGQYWIEGVSYGADIRVPQQTISVGDSDQTIAHTKFVKQAIAAAVSGGGATAAIEIGTMITSSTALTSPGSSYAQKLQVVDCTSGAVTLTFPVSGPSVGKSIIIKKADGTANALTIGSYTTTTPETGWEFIYDTNTTTWQFVRSF